MLFLSLLLSHKQLLSLVSVKMPLTDISDLMVLNVEALSNLHRKGPSYSLFRRDDNEDVFSNMMPCARVSSFYGDQCEELFPKKAHLYWENVWWVLHHRCKVYRHVYYHVSKRSTSKCKSRLESLQSNRLYSRKRDRMIGENMPLSGKGPWFFCFSF